MKYLLITTLGMFSISAFSAQSITTNTDTKNKVAKEEVLDNPTLKTLSGSLSRWSLMSTYTYRGGSLKEPGSAERPSIKSDEIKPTLVDMSGTIGIKYRITKSDNISLQLGLYSTTPFHSELDSDNPRNQETFNKHHQNLNAENPTLSYFKTYYIGKLQNITFVKYSHVTRESYRDFGYRGVAQFNHAAAFRINKAAYIAGSVTYENYSYDSDTIEYFGRDVSIRDRQPGEKYRANISGEMYVKRNLSFRFITDVFEFQKMRNGRTPEKLDLQQTLAMTYFHNRDISIAPNLRFIAEDIRDDRTNVGLTLNVNI